MHHVSDNGKLFSGLEKQRSPTEGLPGHPQMPAEEQRSGGHALRCARRPDVPLWKGGRGIETSGSGYLRLQIRGGRKGRAHRQGLGQQPHNIAKSHRPRITRASSDAGPELAGRESHAAMESPQALIAPLERGSGGLKRNARSVSVWPSAPIQKKESPQTNV